MNPGYDVFFNDNGQEGGEMFELDHLLSSWTFDRWVRSIFVLGYNMFKLLYLTNFFLDDFENIYLDCQFK